MTRLHPSAVWLTTLLLAGACAGGGARPTADGGSGGERELVAKPGAARAVAGYSDPAPDFTRDLLAGDGSVAGSVSVRNDTSQIKVEFTLNGAPAVSAAYVYIGDTAPAADADAHSFPAQASYESAVSSCSIEVPLGEAEAGQRLFAAACVEVGGELLWARGSVAGNGFVSLTPGPGADAMAVAPPGLSPVAQTTGSPAQAVSTDIADWTASPPGVQSFEYTVLPVFAPLTEWRTFVAGSSHPWGTWGVDFTSGEGLPFEDQGVFTGWCVDRAHSMYAGQPYEIQLWSCYDASLPEFAQSSNYDLICYLITQRNTNHSYPWNVNWGTQAGRIAFQDAVWYFMGGGGMPGEGSLGYRIVQDALANGEGFVPGPGEYYAAVLYPRTTTNDPAERAQEIVVEVPVPDHTI